MFTGIVEETGKVLEFAERDRAWRLRVGASRVLAGLEIGDSVAVNGCCLTAVAFDGQSVGFDLLAESVRLAGFDALRMDMRVNLERSLSFNGKVGGHFVSGHVDARGEIVAFEERGKDRYLRIAPPAEFLRYVVYKGSIAIDGVSLTVAEVDETGFAVWLIPHTLKATNLGDSEAGRRVNLEFDLLAKYVEKLMPVP